MAARQKQAESQASLDGVFRPRSVAVIGASRHKGSIGHLVVANLVTGGFTGPVYPVNPKADVVHSMKCYPSVEDIPDPVDLAVIVVPAKLVLKTARSCARKGVKGLVIVTAGFNEIGGEGALRERKLVEIARKAGMRIVGPNCMGIINTEPEFSLNASFAAARPRPGNVAFVSQSGALGEAILTVANEVDLGIRMFASVGNRADIGAHDLLEYWERQDGVKLILLYLESFGDPTRFKAAAERLRGRKAIIAVKSGRSPAGARAAGSHTGSIAGSDSAVDTFLFQCGVLRAPSLRTMFDFASAILHQPAPKGESIAVVTNAGGPGILATDALDSLGHELAEFEPKTMRLLRKSLPPEASPQNPIDLIASADAERYDKALSAVVADKNVHALLVLFVSPTMIDAHAVATMILERTRASGKPVVACIMGKERNDEAVQLLSKGGIPVFNFPEEAAETLAGMIRHRYLSLLPTGKPVEYEVDRAKVKRILSAARRAGGGWVPSVDVRKILEAYGFPVIPSKMVSDPGKALEAARAMGYPVCLKATSRKLVHKSDLGGVKCNLSSGDDVYDFALEMRKKFGRDCKDLAFEVQAMAKGHRELLLGFTREPRFGPLLAIGMGGTHVEVLKDVAVRVGPLTDADPAQMLASLRAAPLLKAFRGEPAIDQDVVEDCLLRLNQLAFDFPEIEECDINPLMAAKKGVSSWVVDARMRLAERKTR